MYNLPGGRRVGMFVSTLCLKADCVGSVRYDVCITCLEVDESVVCQHPMFEGGLCRQCKV